MDEGGEEEEGRKRRRRGSEESVCDWEEVSIQGSDLPLKSIIIQNKALRGWPATPPPDTQDSFSHNSSDPRPGLSSICQPVCDNYHFEMPARHRASVAPC